MFLACFFHENSIFIVCVCIFLLPLFFFSANKATRLRHRSEKFVRAGGSREEIFWGRENLKKLGFPRQECRSRWTDKRIRASGGGERLNSLRRRSCSTFPVRAYQCQISVSTPERHVSKNFYLATSAVVEGSGQNFFSQQPGCTQKPLDSNTLIHWLWRKWKSKEKCCWPYPMHVAGLHNGDRFLLQFWIEKRERTSRALIVRRL